MSGKSSRVAVCAVAVLMLVGLPLSAAGKQESTEGVTINVLNLSGHKQFTPVWEKIAEFERETGIKVILTEFPYGELVTKIMRDLQLHQGRFDVLEITDIVLPSAQEYVLSLNEFIERDMPLEQWKKQFFPGPLKHVIYDGEVKYFPHYLVWQVGLYRADLFEDPAEQRNFRAKYGYELGVPQTMEQLVDIAQFFTRDTNNDGEIDLWGLLFPGADHSHHTFDVQWFQSGKPYYDDDYHCYWGPQHPENHEFATQIAQFNQDCIWKYKITPPAAVGMGMSEIHNYYLEGHGAMIHTWAYLIWKEAQLPQTVNRIGKTKSWVFPSWVHPPQGQRLGMWTRAINADSKHPEAAWEFLKWATSKENTKLALEKGPGAFVAPYPDVAEWAGDVGVSPPVMLEIGQKAHGYSDMPAIAQIFSYMEEMHQKLLASEIEAREWVIQTGQKLEDAAAEARK